MSPPDRSSSRPRLIGLPVGLVLVSLLALVAVPLVVHQRIEVYRERRARLLQPARDAVNRVQVVLAQEVAAVQEFTIPGAEEFLDRGQARDEVERSLTELADIADALEPEIAGEVERLSAAVSDWNDRVEEVGRGGSGVGPFSAVGSEPLYRRTLVAAERLREALLRVEDRDRRAIRRLDRVETLTTAGLGVIALIAGGITLWLGRQRIVAWEARRDRREAERVLESRSRFVRGLTHDLKNPLGAARGHLRLLQEGVLHDRERRGKALARMDHAIGRAVDLVDDLLRLSRAEAGELSVDVEPVDLAPVLRGTAGEYRAEAERKEVTLRIDVSERLPVVTTDPRRVGDILRNLLSNGIKYTPADGEVCLSARRLPEAEGDEVGRRSRGSVAVEVSDTGPGIAPEDLDRIFLEFSRLGAGESEGLGLGLAMSREVARLLGGELTVTSEPGEGSTFTLVLPLEPPPELRPPARESRQRPRSWRRRLSRRPTS